MDKASRKILLVNQSSGDLFNKLFEMISRKHDVTMFKGISYKKNNFFNRLSTWLIYTLQLFFHLLIYGRKYKHILIVSNPPFAILVAPFAFNSYSFLLYDLYPNVLNQLKNNYLSHIFIKIISIIWNIFNLVSFYFARNIFTLSQSMADEIRSSTYNFFNLQSKVRVAPLWKSFSLKKLNTKEIERKRLEYGFENKFVIGYSGNIGFTHPLEFLVEIAALRIKNVLVVIVGEGPKKKKLLSLSAKFNLDTSNLIFLDFLGKKDFQGIFSCFDLSVVALDKKSSSYSLPSKTITSLEFGKPILGLACDNSDLAKLIINYNCGIVFNPFEGNKSLFKKRLQRLVKERNKLKLFSKNTKIALKSFSLKNADVIINALIS